MPTDKVDAVVIFGATGDLAKLETFPALVGLVDRGVRDVPVIGVAKSGWGLGQFRNYAADALRLNKMDPSAPAATKMLGLLRYVDGNLDDSSTYQAMSAAIGAGRHVLFYLEVPPPLFGRIATGISEAGRADNARVMVEKPFGTDLNSALQLNQTMHKFYAEDAIYWVDHWLGLDPVGGIRDVVENHLLQVLATMLADPPGGSGLQSWRASKSQFITTLRPLLPEDTVRGQYDGYQDVQGVAPGSTTESFAAVRLASDSWRWADVPILIRAGKCMPVTATEVSIRFRRPPHDVFGMDPANIANALRFRINPEAQVRISLVGKKQGAGWAPQQEELTFAEQPASDMRAYDRLIGAALSGERWLFARQDTVEAAWRVVDPILGNVVPLHSYPRGSWGPKEADSLLPEGVPWDDPA